MKSDSQLSVSRNPQRDYFFTKNKLQRLAIKDESFAELINQISLIGKMEVFGVAAKNES